MNENIASYYKNSICFDDLEQIKLTGNWFNSSYKNILISIERCQNTAAFPEKCESP